MSKPEHVELIKNGVSAWNDWREQHPEAPMDLSEADLRGLKLQNVNLKGTDLKAAKLQFANLSGANLEGANLDRARLQEVDLTRAQMKNAVVKNCNLMEANLLETNQENADIQGSQFNEDVMFHQANLKGANLDNATGLSIMQIKAAVVDKTTKLPEYLSDDTDDEEFLNSML